MSDNETDPGTDLGAFAARLRVPPGGPIDLTAIDPAATPGFRGGETQADAELARLSEELFAHCIAFFRNYMDREQVLENLGHRRDGPAAR